MPSIAPYNDDNYQAKDDARTLGEAEKIKADKKRLKAATACLEKDAGATASAHKVARKALEKHTKARLAKTFAPEGSPAEEKAESPAEAKSEGDTY